MARSGDSATKEMTGYGKNVLLVEEIYEQKGDTPKELKVGKDC